MDELVSPRTVAAIGCVGRLSRAGTIADAEALLTQAVGPFGMFFYATWLVPDTVPPLPGEDLRSTIITNWPDEWVENYLARQRYLIDRVILRATALSGSFCWHELGPPETPEAIALAEDIARYGVTDGFTLSWRSLEVPATVLSLAGQPITWSSMELAAVAAVAEAFLQRTIYLRRQGGERAVQSLSPQERRILHLCALGKSDKEIMRHLNVQRGTILTHWSRIRGKLGAADRTQAVARGIASKQLVF